MIIAESKLAADSGPWTMKQTTLTIVRGLVTPEDVDCWQISSSQGVVCYVPDDGSERAKSNAELICHSGGIG